MIIQLFRNRSDAPLCPAASPSLLFPGAAVLQDTKGRLNGYAFSI